MVTEEELRTTAIGTLPFTADLEHEVITLQLPAGASPYLTRPL